MNKSQIKKITEIAGDLSEFDVPDIDLSLNRSFEELNASYWEAWEWLMIKYGKTKDVITFGIECLEGSQIDKVGINSRDFYTLAVYVEDHGGSV